MNPLKVQSASGSSASSRVPSTSAAKLSPPNESYQAHSVQQGQSFELPPPQDQVEPSIERLKFHFDADRQKAFLLDPSIEKNFTIDSLPSWVVVIGFGQCRDN